MLSKRASLNSERVRRNTLAQNLAAISTSGLPFALPRQAIWLDIVEQQATGVDPQVSISLRGIERCSDSSWVIAKDFTSGTRHLIVHSRTTRDSHDKIKVGQSHFKAKPESRVADILALAKDISTLQSSILDEDIVSSWICW